MTQRSPSYVAQARTLQAQLAAAQNLITAQQLALAQLPPALYMSHGTTTVGGTTTETSIMPASFYGSPVIPVSYWQPGYYLTVDISGVFSTVTLTPGTATVRVYLGATQVGVAATSTLVGGLSTQLFKGSTTIQCMTSGSSGSVLTVGDVTYTGSGIAAVVAAVLKSTSDPAGVTALDLSAPLPLRVTLQWSNGSAQNTATALKVLVTKYGIN